MNIKDYNYYGNYDNNDSLFSINDLQKDQASKDKSRNNIYHFITKKCFAKIKETHNNNITYCFFNLPEYIPGYPLYNMTECVLYILKKLKEKGFSCRYVDSFIIYISWHNVKNSQKMIENKKNVLDDIELKYKPIENSNSFNFIPRKKS